MVNDTMNMPEQGSPMLPRPMPGFALAMAYVPFQKWEAVYPPETGFSRGTIFEQLDLPFIGEEAVPRD